MVVGCVSLEASSWCSGLGRPFWGGRWRGLFFGGGFPTKDLDLEEAAGASIAAISYSVQHLVLITTRSVIINETSVQ